MLATVQNGNQAITVGGLASGLAARMERQGMPAASPLVIAVDGWSGSGKTYLANRLAPALGAACVHLDDFVPGWFGLARSVELLVEWVLEPLATGRDAVWRSWDWQRNEFGQQTVLNSRTDGIVVVEGCGAGSAAARPWLSALVWIDASGEERTRRLQTRHDWFLYEPWFEVWAHQEQALRANDCTPLLADVVVRMDDDLPDIDARWRAAWRV
jgi:cytidylate kinase